MGLISHDVIFYQSVVVSVYFFHLWSNLFIHIHLVVSIITIFYHIASITLRKDLVFIKSIFQASSGSVMSCLHVSSVVFCVACDAFTASNSVFDVAVLYSNVH